MSQARPTAASQYKSRRDCESLHKHDFISRPLHHAVCASSQQALTGRTRWKRRSRLVSGRDVRGAAGIYIEQHV
eukprot:6176556-Pleurochrysis_carterae.AAC.1